MALFSRPKKKSAQVNGLILNLVFQFQARCDKNRLVSANGNWANDVFSIKVPKLMSFELGLKNPFLEDVAIRV